MAKGLERTCKNCGHVWLLGEKERRQAQTGKLTIAMGRLPGAALAMLKKSYDTCPMCGSVGTFTERTIPV